MNAEDFARKYGKNNFRHCDELLHLIASGHCSVTGSSLEKPPVSNVELRNIYKRRVGHLLQFNTPHANSIREDCEELCRNLEANPQGSCRGWIFSAGERLFYVFEEVETEKILSCIGGVDRRMVNEQKWEGLWGEVRRS